MTKLIPLSCLILIAGAVATAHAQVVLDMSKVTCDQFTGYKITNPQNIANWLSGYYNGQRGNTILDTQELAAHTQKLRDFCITHPEMPVMRAVETLMAPKK
jgi:acid stress chaperone HdeB